jgi:CheY-like chemotaxis protein
MAPIVVEIARRIEPPTVHAGSTPARSSSTDAENIPNAQRSHYNRLAPDLAADPQELMSSAGDIDELCDLIARLRLVSLGDLRACQSDLIGRATEADLLDLLQRKELLTSFQAEKLQKRDTEDLVLGDYKLQYRNAAGSFARVYRGCSVIDGSMVGIKVLRDRWSNDPDTVKLFRREGEIGQRLKHPGIVPIYSVEKQGPVHYITMEFIEGGNLRDFLKIRGKLDPIEASRYGVQMADGLEYALNLGITHRDLKLTNVLMSAQGGVKLIDFGLGADESMLNRADGPELAQALEYSTLEKGSNSPRNDPRSDLFFLGTILYELVTGVPPYARSRDREERKRFSRYRDIRPVTSLDPRLPHRIADVIDRLLHTNPELRYQRPAEAAADLRAALGSQHAPGAPAATAGKKAEPLRILCIEDRPKHQDVLRDYLSKRGYRVLLLSAADRAVSRVEQQPPDGLILMGQSVEDGVLEAFQRIVDADLRGQMASILVLSEKQASERLAKPPSEPRVRVLTQPISLRALRLELEDVLSQLGKSVPTAAENGD